MGQRREVHAHILARHDVPIAHKNVFGHLSTRQIDAIYVVDARGFGRSPNSHSTHTTMSSTDDRTVAEAPREKRSLAGRISGVIWDKNYHSEEERKFVRKLDILLITTVSPPSSPVPGVSCSLSRPC